MQLGFNAFTTRCDGPAQVREMKGLGMCGLGLILLVSPCLAIASHELAIYQEQKALAVVPDKQLSTVAPRKCDEVKTSLMDVEQYITFQ